MSKPFQKFSAEEARVGIEHAGKEKINVTVDEQSLLGMANQIGAYMADGSLAFWDAKRTVFKSLQIRSGTDASRAYSLAIGKMISGRKLADIQSHTRTVSREDSTPISTHVDEETGQVAIDF